MIEQRNVTEQRTVHVFEIDTMHNINAVKVVKITLGISLDWENWSESIFIDTDNEFHKT